MAINNDLPISDGAPKPVPVFDCHVLLREEDGMIVARAANLEGVSGKGATERDALMQIVKQFKRTVEGFVGRGETVPFLEPHEEPKDGDMERWVPVHL